MEALVAGALVGYGITKLLDCILAAMKTIKRRKKSFLALESLLQRLRPLLFHTDRLAKRIDVVRTWQGALQKKLKEAENVILDYSKLRSVDVIETFRVLKRLVEVTADVRESESEASNMVLATLSLTVAVEDDISAALRAWQSTATQYDTEIKEEMRELRTDVARISFALHTRNTVNTSTRNLHHDVNTISPAEAFVQIKNQATAVVEISNYPDDASPAETPPMLSPSEMQDQLHDADHEMAVGNENLELLKKMLLSTDNPSKWVGICGMGGSGKTFTSRRAYNDPDIITYFEGGTYWLTVGRVRSTLALLNELFVAVVGESRNLTTENATKVLKGILSNKKKVLLVLDDVWTDHVRNCLDVVAESSGSKILVTTRIVAILDQVFASKLPMGLLADSDSWQLFCQHAFMSANSVPFILEALAKQVAAECKGLPLALKIIGGSMAGKLTRVQWEIALKRLRNADIVSKDHEEQLFGRLQWSVDDLATVHKHLVDCFHCFAAFPEDAEVNFVEDLLGLWAADGVLERSSGLFPEEEAYELLGWLIARSLIELHTPESANFKLGTKKLMTFKIHDVLRDLARYNLERGRETYRRCLYRPGLELTSFPQEWGPCGPETSGSDASNCALRVRRLSLMHNNLRQVPLQLTAPHLQVLLLGYNSLSSFPAGFFRHLSGLKVLDLRHTAVKEIPDQAFTILRSLVFLNLSHCRDLLKIPRSIRNLQHLRELRLDFCENLKSLPAGVFNLKELEIFTTFESRVWENDQESWRSVANVISGPWSGRAIFKKVNLLPNLTSLEISASDIRQQDVPLSMESLKLLRNLRLDLTFNKDFPDVSELRLLESFKIKSFEMVVPPSGLLALSNLKVLEFEWCLSLKFLPALDTLPHLECLTFNKCSNLKTLPPSFGRCRAFPSLLELSLNDCENISAEDFPCLQIGAMPQLMLLDLRGWTKLKKLPDSLQVLQTLRGLLLSQCRNLATLEPAFGSDCFPDLEELNLQGTAALHQLPSTMPSLLKLRKLNIAGCGARQELAERFQHLERLRM